MIRIRLMLVILLSFPAISTVVVEMFVFNFGFLSRTFTIYSTSGEGEGYFFNSSIPLPPASQTLFVLVTLVVLDFSDFSLWGGVLVRNISLKVIACG